MKSTMQTNKGSVAIVVAVVVVLVVAGYMFWPKSSASPTVQSQNNYSAPVKTQTDDLSAELNSGTSVDSSAELKSIDSEFK
jgi:hypothetical protein